MSRAQSAFEALSQRGGDFIEVPIVLEASVPLELSGEVVRNRICTFTDEDGQEWALRPDLTLPVAQAEMNARAAGLNGETIRHYRGPVFRLPAVAGEPVEYEQIGIERFGAARGVAEDVWIFETLAAACVAAGRTRGVATFGDLSIFPAFVDALGLRGEIAAGLKRAFRQEGGVRAFLAGQRAERSGMAARLAGLERAEIGAFVEDIFAMTGIQPVGERSADEIIERLFQRAQITDLNLSDEQAKVLSNVLSIEVPVADAPAQLQDLARAAGLNQLDDTLDLFAQRTDQLARSPYADLISEAGFATRFGRRFTYYDGFVFEIASDASAAARQRPFASGGRYDALLTDLSAGAVSATAIGGIVMPHRFDDGEGAGQ